MTIEAPFPGLDYGILMADFNQSFQFQQPMMMAAMPEPTLGSLIERQTEEIDRFVQQQSNLLRASIEQQSRQHLGFIIRTIDARASAMMRQKEEELAVVGSRTLQLEACLKRQEQDREAWERVARESEAMAMSLSSALEQLQRPCFSSNGRAVDEKGEEITSSWPKESLGRCKICVVRDSCVLLLPCRHLCCCLVCDALAETCPVCGSAKDASVEVFLA